MSIKAKALREKNRREETEKKIKRETDLRKKLEKKALNKLKNGEKLNFDEFKVLAEQGKI